ncbi:CpsD/CapB family tyrosine-protein kinase [Oceanidesulfovibrio marinus]|uniref:CpsD/CapB family tyrosine-protein kinase n=1 Tax=Oceanidesulfovibrio marinus TaxID=370038 RepID=A0A6P1ZEB1_9BACT|nr:CpsD/CapB family tyrosine-protein kinase [Oceanidesulfovibrio marinus]QJT07734.1 CpsD/CapB family tyrosine-protein kinase [Oceanidesulfovibrio marinus]TVM32087.1 hypothetical protein DQK91_16275 [Oceanidesulfovibrio marinus]
MTKIFEALQRVEKEHKGYDSSSMQTSYGHMSNTAGSVICNSEGLSNSMVNLYQYVMTALPDMDCRIISFNESRMFEGSSVLCREFAKVLVSQLGKKVLVLDFSEHNYGTASYFNIHRNGATSQDDDAPMLNSDAVHQIESSTLYVCRARVNRDADYKPMFEALRNDYDMILLDMPPVVINPSSLVITKFLDGAILVVESEKTRWQVANKSVKSIMTHNSNILGVILNKQQYHIPQFIYNHI